MTRRPVVSLLAAFTPATHPVAGDATCDRTEEQGETGSTNDPFRSMRAMAHPSVIGGPALKMFRTRMAINATNLTLSPDPLTPSSRQFCLR